MKLYTITFIILLLFIGTTVHSQNTYIVDSNRVVTKVLGTETTYSNLSLKENLSKIPAFSRQVQIFELTDFDTFIQGIQMVTVFVVKNNAFDFMNEKELKQFLSSSNSIKLSAMQSYYVIPGRVDEHAIRKSVTDGSGTASYRTINNKIIRFLAEGESIYIYTDTGSRSKLLETDFLHSKGFFHVTEKLPVQQK